MRRSPPLEQLRHLKVYALHLLEDALHFLLAHDHRQADALLSPHGFDLSLQGKIQHVLVTERLRD